MKEDNVDDRLFHSNLSICLSYNPWLFLHLNLKKTNKQTQYLHYPLGEIRIYVATQLGWY